MQAAISMKNERINFYCPYGHRLRFDEAARKKEQADKLTEDKKPNLRLVVNNETK